MVSGAFYIPKDNILKPVGDDAHFISDDKKTIGVADGVGGWTKEGIDAGEYVRELIMYSAIVVDKYKAAGKVIDPKRVLQKAFSYTKLPGSSTACIVTHDRGILSATNIGDSGFMVFRDRKLLYTSPIQQHRINHPYQLGSITKRDHPNCALELTVEVMAVDIVVLGSDGLLDNVCASNIEEILRRSGEEEEPEELAYKIAGKAYNNSLGDKGKPDDITVLVSQIVLVPRPTESSLEG